MKISTKGRYALRLMLDLAYNHTGSFIPIKNISQRQDISDKYLEQIITQLSRAGLVKSARGAQGGYMLAKEPQEYTVGEIRPDGGPHSFPSGHTANAFLGAHVAWKEFKDSCPVLAYSGYALATFVACSRLYNNRHWVADVIAGAGFGILSVELAYLTYFPIRNAIARKINMKGNDRLVVAPTFRPDGGGLYLSWKF